MSVSLETERLRAIPLPTVVGWLGHDLAAYKKRGKKQEWYGRCIIKPPKTNDTSFSFTNSVFHCFSCGSKGKGAIDLVMEARYCTFTNAVDWLREQAGGQPRASDLTVEPRKESDEALDNTRTENPLFKASYEKFYQPCNWLEKRIPRPVLDRFGVGLYHNPSRKSPYDGKVMLPIRRFSDGEKTGYLARTIAPEAGQAKYVFPKQFLKSIEVYGAWELKAQSLPLRVAYLVESPFCVMKFHSLGLPAVSCFGWSISQSQADILAQIAKGWIYLPDRNKFDAVHNSLHLLARRCWVKLPELPTDIDDPENLTPEQIKAL